MNKIVVLLVLSSLSILSSCLSPRDYARFQLKEIKKDQKKKPSQTVSLGEVKISPKKKQDFRIVPSSIIDILHTDLDVSFNWGKHECVGKETMLLKPYFYETDTILLDAKNMTFNGITLFDKDKNPILYTLQYDKKILKLILERKLNVDDTIKLTLDYTASPDEQTEAGSAAIRDAKGLYFINTDHEEPNKPLQIWTQGETESNSCWFPTIDKPNEKFTLTLSIKVNKEFTTLSNGELISSTNDGNTKTDVWEMKKPIPAYLVMMAIGDFKITQDELVQEVKESTIRMQYDTIGHYSNDSLHTYIRDSIRTSKIAVTTTLKKDLLNGKKVTYYLEPKYAPYALDIFKNTPEMIDFYSNKLGVEYPWNKYAQVVVRDYVSGAMENASATLHGEFIQKNKRQLIDKNNEDVVSHELFHQWFGDLVTCKSWSHLVVNEGFATFGEQLWAEYKYGADASLLNSYNSLNKYLNYVKDREDDPIVQFNYKDKEDMFSSITYQKGSRVLNLLRSEIGDIAFFASLKNYLTLYAYQNADIDDLRKEFEKVTGRDLRNFFNQWFLKGGHPIIELHYDYNDSTKLTGITIEQKQNSEFGLFSFPLKFKITQNGQTKYFTFTIEKRKEVFFVQKFDKESSDKPTIFVDPEATFIGELKDYQPFINQIKTYHQATSIIEKLRSLQSLSEQQNTIDTARSTLHLALIDTNGDIRLKALQWIDWKNEKNYKEAREQLLLMASKDEKSLVRAKAIEILSNQKEPSLMNVFNSMTNDSSYTVAGQALEAVYKLLPEEGLRLCVSLQTDAKGELFNQISSIYSTSGEVKDAAFFETNLMKVFNSQRASLVNDYADFCERLHDELIFNKAIELLTQRSNHDQNTFVRATSILSLHKIYQKQVADNNLQKDATIKATKQAAIQSLNDSIHKIIEQEQDEDVLSILKLRGLTKS